MTNQKVPSKVPSISNVSTLDAANGQSRPTYYIPGLAEYLGVPNLAPTDVAFACMVHLRDLQREGYRARKAAEPAMRSAAQERAIAAMARKLSTGLDQANLGTAEGSPGPSSGLSLPAKTGVGRPPPPGFAGAL